MLGRMTVAESAKRSDFAVASEAAGGVARVEARTLETWASKDRDSEGESQR